MSLLSRKVDYGLLILSYLDQCSDRASSREIADHFGLDRGFTANILKALCQQEIVESHRGVKGGYVPAATMSEITLADLMEALDDEVYLAQCNKPGDTDPCTLTSVCTVKGAIAQIHARIHDLLKSVTLAELFHNGSEGSTIELSIGLSSLRE